MRKQKNTDYPKHVAIILDGNGRWAKDRNFPRVKGHFQGAKRVREIIQAADNFGIKILTLYVFSSENWTRPKQEVSTLMSLLGNLLKNEINNLNKNNVKFITIGRKEFVPPKLLKIIENTIEKTRNNSGMILNLAFNYGSRNEIIDAIKEISEKVKKGSLSVKSINEKIISESLYTKDLPDPDLLIRTSGEKRLSNFLLWQLSYSELYFTDIYWPDFGADELKNALLDYQNRERRFGNVSERK